MSPADPGKHPLNDAIRSSIGASEDYQALSKVRGVELTPPVNLIKTIAHPSLVTLKETVQKRLGIAINISQLRFNGIEVSGGLYRYDSHAEIWYSQNLNTCWSRFIIAKEMSHLLLGREENYTSDPIDLVSRLLGGAMFMYDGSYAHIECAAIFAAVELLMPKIHKDHYYSMAEKGSNGVEDVANEYRIPAIFARFRLSERGRAIFEEAYAS